MGDPSRVQEWGHVLPYRLKDPSARGAVLLELGEGLSRRQS